MSLDRALSGSADRDAQVLVPVKAFGRAKQRLADHLEADVRSRLAQAMAETVLRAADPLGVVVVCDDDEVRRWAIGEGARVCWTPGCDLNDALSTAIGNAADSGVERVVIAHADLPFANDLARFAHAGRDEVVIVPDRHGRGTNVMSLPTTVRFALSYGPDSCGIHRRAALAAGLEVTEVEDPALGWDVDEPADLAPPAHLGDLPVLLGGCRPGKAM